MALTQPFGMNTALSPNNPGGRGMSGLVTNEKERAKDYQRANRLLRRAARRGDINAAVNLVKFGDMASKAGYQVSGITSAEGNVAGAMSDINSRIGATKTMSDIAKGDQAVLQTRATPTVNPATTPTGNPAVVPTDVMGAPTIPDTTKTDTASTAPINDSAEQERLKRERLTREGAFGTGAQRMLAARKRSFVDRIADTSWLPEYTAGQIL